MNAASLCSLAGRYENPIPPWCLAPIDFLKIPELVFLDVYGAPESIPRNESASLCSLAGRYDNPIPPRFLAPIDFLKIPAQLRLHSPAESIPWNRFLGSLKGLQIQALVTKKDVERFGEKAADLKEFSHAFLLTNKNKYKHTAQSRKANLFVIKS
jgi:hypothetical protein